MLDKAQIIEDMNNYFTAYLPTLAEYETFEDAPYSSIQIRRVFGSWDRFLSFITPAPVVTPTVKKVVTETKTK